MSTSYYLQRYENALAALISTSDIDTRLADALAEISMIIDDVHQTTPSISQKHLAIKAKLFAANKHDDPEKLRLAESILALRDEIVSQLRKEARTENI